MLLGLAAALLVVALPTAASASAELPSYAETRLCAFQLQIPAGIGAERGLSQTSTRGYGEAYDGQAKGSPLVPGGAAGSRIGVTRHGVNQKINRGVRSVDELDAIKNPLDTRPVKIDELGRPSQRVVGRNAEVVRNPRTGEIISVNPTSTKKAQRLLRRLEDQ